MGSARNVADKLTRSAKGLHAALTSMLNKKPHDSMGISVGQLSLGLIGGALSVVLVGAAAIATVTSPERASSSQEASSVPALRFEPSIVVSSDIPEPEVYHSSSQYLNNSLLWRKKLEQLRPFRYAQRVRQEQLLTSLQVRVWDSVGATDTEECFQYLNEVSCLETERLGELRKVAEAFQRDYPYGIGICTDWFGDVCISGDWFPSLAHYQRAINDSLNYVMKGEWPNQPNVNASEGIPVRDPSVIGPDLGSDERNIVSAEEWEALQDLLGTDFLPDQENVNRDVNGCVTVRGQQQCVSDEQLEAARQANEAADQNSSEEGFSVCYSRVDGVCMEGDYFESKEQFDRAMAELEEYQRNQESNPAPDPDPEPDPGPEPEPEPDPEPAPEPDLSE